MKLVSINSNPVPRRYVAYYRVSTDRQGQSGLGLEAQQVQVEHYVSAYGGQGASIIGGFTDIQSGRSTQRPQLAAALAECRRTGATLVVAKLDRLARNAKFFADLVENDVDVVFGNLPQLPPGSVGKFMIQIMASIAELESGMISDRTKAAMDAAKARGTKLGGWRGNPMAEHCTAASVAVRIVKADTKAAEAVERVKELLPGSGHTYAEMARALNQDGVTTATGGPWDTRAVRRALTRVREIELAKLEEARARAASMSGLGRARRLRA
jgi:DNA invertase Pin-like site-specific DNA recombinase